MHVRIYIYIYIYVYIHTSKQFAPVEFNYLSGFPFAKPTLSYLATEDAASGCFMNQTFHSVIILKLLIHPAGKLVMTECQVQDGNDE